MHSDAWTWRGSKCHRQDKPKHSGLHAFCRRGQPRESAETTSSKQEKHHHRLDFRSGRSRHLRILYVRRKTGDVPGRLRGAGKAVKVMRLPPLPTIRDLIRLYKLRALKQLSQNFLLDNRHIERIVKAAGHIQGHTVVEVGPGPGGITRALLRRRPSRLVLVEKDERFLPSLEMLADAVRDQTSMDIIIGDVLTTDITKFTPKEARHEWNDAPPPLHLVGNLPFSVSTALLILWLKQISRHEGPWSFGRTRLTLTFQKEVAERMTAPLLDSQRCRLSVMCQTWCKVNYQFTIPGGAFQPKPDVDVGVVTLTPLRTPLIAHPFELVEKVVRQIFHMRQKYAMRGCGTLFPEDAREQLALRMFALADLDPTTRPFKIANMEFARLCDAYAAMVSDRPDLWNYEYRARKNPVLAQQVEAR